MSNLKEKLANALGTTTQPHIFTYLHDPKELKTLMDAKAIAEKYGFQLRVFKVEK